MEVRKLWRRKEDENWRAGDGDDGGDSELQGQEHCKGGGRGGRELQDIRHGRKVLLCREGELGTECRGS